MKIFFSVITRTLKWKISTKYFVTFKRSDGVKDEKFNIIGGLWKIRFLGMGGVHEKPIYLW